MRGEIHFGIRAPTFLASHWSIHMDAYCALGHVLQEGRINNLSHALSLQEIKILKCFPIINLRLKSLIIYLKIKLSWYTDVVPWLICVVGHIYQIHPSLMHFLFKGFLSLLERKQRP